MIATTRRHHGTGMDAESSNDPVAVPPPPEELGKMLYQSLESYANIEESMKLASLPSIDLNYADSQGITPLMLACSQRHQDLVKIIIDNGGRVNHADKSGATVLSKAVGSGDLEIVNHLLRNGAEVRTDKFALAPAVQHGYTAIFDLLMERQASLEPPNQHVLPVLEAAILRGDLCMVRRLKEGGADVNLVSGYYSAWRTPLMAAAACGEEGVFRYLCEEGADPTASNQKGESMVMFAALGHSLSILQHCLQHPSGAAAASAASLSGETALMWAAGGSTEHATLGRPAATGSGGDSSCGVDALKVLLAAGADVNAAAKDGRTALMFAAAAGRANGVRFLLESGANKDCRTDAGETALMLAAQSGKADTVNCLLDHGADPSLLTKNGASALFYAARGGSVEAVQRLLVAGLDVNHKNQDQETPLMRAVQYRRAEVVRALLGHQADANTVSKGTTPLHWAATKGHSDIAALLIQHGADMEWKNTAGLSALDAARGATRAAMERAILLRRREGQQAQAQAHAVTDDTPTAARDRQNGIERVPPLPPDRQAELGAQMGSAIKMGDVERVKSLLATPGLDVDYRFEGSETALIAACYEGRSAVAQLLVDAGADLDLQDADGWTALHWAAYRCFGDIVRLLLRRGASTSIQGRKGKTAAQTAVGPEIRAIFQEFVSTAADDSGPKAAAEAGATAQAMAQAPTRTADELRPASTVEKPLADAPELEVPQESMGGSAPSSVAVAGRDDVTALSMEFESFFANNSSGV